MPTAQDGSLQSRNSNIVFYSDTFVSVNTPVDPLEGIKTRLAALSIGTARDDDLPESRIHHWQRWVDSQINAKLSSVYRVPLVRITRADRNLDVGGVATPFFPDPIQDIAIAMVVAQIVIVEYTDVDPNTNEAANALQQKADADLSEICGGDGMVGTIELEGQEPKARSRFAPPTAMPRSMSKPPMR